MNLADPIKIATMHMATATPSTIAFLPTIIPTSTIGTACNAAIEKAVISTVFEVYPELLVKPPNQDAVPDSVAKQQAGIRTRPRTWLARCLQRPHTRKRLRYTTRG